MSRERNGLLVTADGAVFRGRAVGAEGITTGEVVFNTSMTGYQEVLTDPSYAGQVVVMTASHIGNYGVAAHDDQAAITHARGFVMRALSRRDSNWRSEGSFAAYLADAGVVALTDVDTRRLTRYIRDRGAQPIAMGSGVDQSELVEMARSAPRMEGLDLATGVSTSTSYEVSAETDRIGTVVAFDLGMKRDIARRLAGLGLDVTVVPAGTPADEVLGLSPNGVFLSNGPGDPEPLTATIDSVRGLLGRVPLFGICLGHQVLGLALGASTYKLGFGHHGGNHPVRRLQDGHVEITSQNHGFAVDLWSLRGEAPPTRVGLAGPELLPDRVESDFGGVIPTHQNLNDGTLEGLACVDVAAFGVQYHPEAAPGPLDATYLFDRFVDLMGLGEEVAHASA